MFKDQLIRYKVIYDRKKEAVKKGKALVQIEVYQNGNRRYFSTGIYLRRDQWNHKKKEPKDPFTFSQIRQVLTTLEDFEKKHRYFHGTFTLKDFDRLVNQMQEVNPTNPALTFNQFFKEQLQSRKKELRWGTYRNHQACLNTLNQFNPTILFSELNYKLVDQFHQFMVAKGHKPFTSHKRHVQVKTYIKKAIKLELMNRNPYEDFKVPSPQADKIALLPVEIKRLEALVFEPGQSRMERVRDMFLFSVYTGLRWGDVSKLTQANFIETADGLVLHVKADKTGKTLEINLRYLFNGKAEPIVRKYWPSQDGVKLFKGIYNAFANLKLKDLASKAGIKKNLHFHISRHTAGTIIAQKAGVLVAKEILQHAKISTTQAYLHLSNSERDKALKEIKEW